MKSSKTIEKNAMLGDTFREVRDLAVKKFGEIRNKPAHNAVRKYKVSSINFKAYS
jgi:hypothetical protein